MQIKIDNIGKIRHAEVVLSGITVIAGLNSTGKSTISKALYNTLCAYANLDEKIIAQRKASIKQSLRRSIAKLSEMSVPDFFIIDVSDEYVNKLTYDMGMEFTADDLVSHIDLLFDGSDLKTAIESNFEEIKGGVEYYRHLSNEYYVNFIVANQFKRSFGNQLSSFGIDESGTIDFGGKERIYLKVTDNKFTECSLSESRDTVPVYIEPRHMLDEYVKKKSHVQRRKNYDEVLLDKIDDENQSLADYDLSAQIENLKNAFLQEVIHGQLRNVESSLVFYDYDFGENVDIPNVASGIKSMGMVIRLLENGRLNPEGTLIIDEPEMNLHPQWQLDFARFLVLLNVRLRINVLINSHSPYFIRALEVYMDEYGNKNNLRLYLTESSENQLYVIKDVTGHSDEIYRQLYIPLENL